MLYKRLKQSKDEQLLTLSGKNMMKDYLFPFKDY